MNKTALFLLLFVSVLGFRVSAQSTYYYLNYQWEDTPGYQVGTEHPSAILLHKEVFEYVPGAEGGVTVHRIVHKAIRLSDDMTVESYNKFGGSLTMRVLPAARKFEELQIPPPDAAMSEVSQIENRANLPDRSGELDFDGDADDIAAE